MQKERPETTVPRPSLKQPHRAGGHRRSLSSSRGFRKVPPLVPICILPPPLKCCHCSSASLGQALHFLHQQPTTYLSFLRPRGLSITSRGGGWGGNKRQGLRWSMMPVGENQGKPSSLVSQSLGGKSNSFFARTCSRV